MEINGIEAVLAAIPLKECVKIPGIKDGSLFRKNVRQSLGNSNQVNKGIARTIKKDPGDFFFFHNGITAICTKLEIEENTLHTIELNVVNGCQSLNTIYSCSESARNAKNAYILFRFYEIDDPEKSDMISTSTNSQSAVKARDLRSNDKAVLAIKKAYEQYYSDGYFISKRGEKPDTVKYNTSHIVNLTELGKQLMAWESQRPNYSYSETKIFDKYFEQLFRVHRDYSPQNIQALHELYNALIAQWNSDNPLELNPSLLAMKSYATYHHLYAISMIICELNGLHSDSVPNPAKFYDLLKKNGLLDTIISTSATCLNMAMERANEEAQDAGRIFSPQNWTKSKTSLKDIRTAISNYLAVLKTTSKPVMEKLKQGLHMENTDFESRWTAD